jgi:thymidylate synthase
LNNFEKQYLNISQDILENGVNKGNRTSIYAKSTFSQFIKHDLQDGFPLLTTKKMFLRGITEELLWFLRGETNSNKLSMKGVKIWEANTTREFLDAQGLTYLPEGEIGCAYSHQWRKFGGEHPLIPPTQGCEGFDQVADVLNKLKENPLDRRIIINGWCANQLQYMALPPCHILYVFYHNPDKNSLSCHLTMRSSDHFLGLPFNIASTALMTHIFAKAVGMNVGEVAFTMVDSHLYSNSFDAAKEQISRVPYLPPTLEIKKDINSVECIEKLQWEDFYLKNYNCHPSLKVDMAV